MREILIIETNQAQPIKNLPQKSRLHLVSPKVVREICCWIFLGREIYQLWRGQVEETTGREK